MDNQLLLQARFYKKHSEVEFELFMNLNKFSEVHFIIICKNLLVEPEPMQILKTLNTTWLRLIKITDLYTGIQLYTFNIMSLIKNV